MPEKETLRRARKDKQEGKSASTQAGEFVREEIHHVREGKHGARSPEQAIAIGLSKARRAGVELPPRKGEAPKKGKPSPKRAHAMRSRLKKEGKSAASKGALAHHARTAARRRTASQRSAAAKKAARTRARR